MTNTKVQAVSWNITRLCNLKCTHCYLPAGFVDTNELANGNLNLSDIQHAHGYSRDAELSQSQCFRVIDEIAEINPEHPPHTHGWRTAITPGYSGDIQVRLGHRVPCRHGHKRGVAER